MKVIAKQVNPRYQKSPIFYPDCFPENIALCGNRDFAEHLPDVFELVRDVLDGGELAEIVEDIRNGSYLEDAGVLGYSSIAEAVKEYFYIPGRTYSPEEVEKIADLVLYYSTERNSSKQDETFCKLLSVVDGRKWDTRTIRGTCQSDWQDVFYPVDEWNREALDAFEIEYFNMGSEWKICEFTDDEEVDEDEPGFYLYCTSWNHDGIRAEIISALGYEPDTLTLYAHVGERTISVWEEV